MVMENQAKYGQKENDVIAQAYNVSTLHGDAFCLFNIKKYLTRFKSDSDKGGNLQDIDKALDYLDRMINSKQAW